MLLYCATVDDDHDDVAVRGRLHKRYVHTNIRMYMYANMYMPIMSRDLIIIIIIMLAGNNRILTVDCRL